jgi:ketosteroid isomerase-like protein
MMMRHRSMLAALALITVACQPAPETAEQMNARMSAEADSAKTYIEAANAAAARHMAAGNTDSALAHYADNAVVMMAGMPPMQGKAAITQGFRGMMQQMGGSLTIAFHTLNVSASGPMAIERGHWVMTAPMADSGSYLTHWHRMDGRWMIVEDINNSSVAPAPPPPARRR